MKLEIKKIEKRLNQILRLKAAGAIAGTASLISIQDTTREFMMKAQAAQKKRRQQLKHVGFGKIKTIC